MSVTGSYSEDEPKIVTVSFDKARVELFLNFMGVPFDYQSYQRKWIAARF